ncbi:PREDICTED: signaling lymphocytic activation molecule-like, partial [Merops nubicus]|uniref:signaling lymphocytic activation molecule-like n=1 Tax=Merops nubicus TaxID=57421 RepID=UPI0004F06753
ASKCWEQAVAAGGTLWLRPENPPQGWAKLYWRVMEDAGNQTRILTVEKDGKVQLSKSPLSQRARFQQETLSLQISPVSTADSGTYLADFETPSGSLTPLFFSVTVLEPVHHLQLETHVLAWAEGWCNLSLGCTAPGASKVSYHWSCTGGAQDNQSQLFLGVQEVTNPYVCDCNASNLVSWDSASTDVARACYAAAPGLFSMKLWWAVAAFLGLALVISLALVATCCWRRKRRKDPPGEPAEQLLSFYAEVGKVQPGQAPSGTSEATVEGNTIYTVVYPKTQQGPIRPQEPESCTIYARIQPLRKSPSTKRKRLDPALVSTAYVEVRGTHPGGR